ncbi:MAG: M24 family metallopeptidase [Candidatus Thermoplasmatota archaeon]|nr:M24 family metallopeptidase [Candidatus Thermoplasmatota archaeon]
MAWDAERLTGPDGEDWRVPVSELEQRRNRMSSALAEADIESALIDDPVELYWLTGGRQNGMMLIGAEDSGIQNTHWVRKSLKRAKFESGGDDAPDPISAQPRMRQMTDAFRSLGATSAPAMLAGKMPHDRWQYFSQKLSALGEMEDCTYMMYGLRETKSSWELEMHRESGRINREMFEAVREVGGEGRSELEMAAAADEVSRAAGFGGRIRMRRWPMDCDRVVIAAGRSGAIPSYFDSAIGGLGASPISSLGAGHAKVVAGEPVIVDIVHLHRGYVSDCTRMFCAGRLDEESVGRLDDMAEIRDAIVASLGRGDNCSEAWRIGNGMGGEMGYSEHLMGMAPEQAVFLGHSVGLELDETPIIADRFDRELPVGGTMAIEPKVIYDSGAIGTEDTFTRTADGMECLTMGNSWGPLTEWDE